MSVHVELTDLINLVVAKGANFLLTMAIFALISSGVNQEQFALFGYWWSIGVMIGGVALGGISSGLVRVISVHRSLSHLRSSAIGFACVLALLCLALVAVRASYPGQGGTFGIVLAVAVFGLLFQIQTAELSLLRAIGASRQNAKASIAVVAAIPLTFSLCLGSSRNLVWMFAALSIAFAVAIVVTYAFARAPLLQFTASQATTLLPEKLFWTSVASFTVINILSYSVLNFDFTLFKSVRSADEFTLLATGKIFFERFLLPLLLVAAGAFSLNVLRHRDSADGQGEKQTRVEIRWRAAYTYAIGCIWLGAVAGYFAYAQWFLKAPAAMTVITTICASAAYLIYAANAVLLDILAVRQGLRAVICHVAVFLVVCFTLQTAAIVNLGIYGWATSWLAFNVFAFVVLSRGEFRVVPAQQ